MKFSGDGHSKEESQAGHSKLANSTRS